MTFDPNRVRSSANARADLPPVYSTAYRPTKDFDRDAFEEAQAAGCKEVPLEVFEAVLWGMCAEEANQTPTALDKLCMLEILEDMGHGYIHDGKYFTVQSYMDKYPLTDMPAHVVPGVTAMPAHVAPNMRIATANCREALARMKAANTAAFKAEQAAVLALKDFKELSAQYDAAQAEYNKYIQI